MSSIDKRNWKIVYSSYRGAEKKAVELVNRELGSYILRDAGLYTIHVLPCEHSDTAILDTNCVVIGSLCENKILQKYIRDDEIPEGGYVVKVMPNPENPDLKLALIAAKNPVEVFYGVVDFVDDYFVAAVPMTGVVHRVHETFSEELPDYCSASAPKIKTRNVFTWGHPISDYRDYIDNMARLRLNQLIIWNDFMPLNAAEIIDYAHEYGIKVIWGYAWGWSTRCDDIDLERLDALTDSVVEKFEREYAPHNVDGIYFQSFTELSFDKIGDKLIADVVTDFVNTTAGRLREKHPDLFIQFGLHAKSVKEHLEYIARVDPSVEIVWEDCGEFPYDYIPEVKDEDEYKKTCEFTRDILSLRKDGTSGILFKGFMTLDWNLSRFCHQKGPFILGKASEITIKHDNDLLAPMWRHLQSEWYKNGHYALDMVRLIAKADPTATVGMAGQFAGGIWLPEAVCAQMLWNPDEDFYALTERASKRSCVKIV